MARSSASPLPLLLLLLAPILFWNHAPVSAQVPPETGAPANPNASAAPIGATLPDDPLPEAMTGSAHLVAVLADDKGPIFVGMSGELYHPAADRRWARTGAGGVAADVLAVFRTATQLYAVGTRAPLYKRAPEGPWSAHHLVNRGMSTASSGALPIISTGRHIYELGASGWRRLASANSAISRLWASSARRFYVVARSDQVFVGRNSWRQIPLTLAAGDRVVRLAGVPGQLAVAFTEQNQIYTLGTRGQRVSRPTELQDLEVQAVGVVGGRLLVAGQVKNGEKARSLLAEVGKRGLTLISELWPLGPQDRFAVLHEDGAQRLYVATQAGQLRVRDPAGRWQNGKIEIAAPPAPPATGAHGPARAR